MRHLGIDLGTTHCSVAYSEGRTVRDFMIPQAVSEGLNATEDQLPSCLHLGESKNFEVLEGYVPHFGFAGRFAHHLSGLRPESSVQSAKSWISLGDIRCEEALLPIDSNATRRVSAVDAQTFFLKHIKTCFEREVGVVDGEVVITVPASFSQASRRLTLKSAEQAGFSKAILVEEPLAAFTCWLHRTAKKPSGVESVLVIDMGGGTTDFSLLRKNPEKDAFERDAVGEHLLLGGDNLDLALAHACASTLSRNLKTSEFAELMAQTRRFKEEVLNGSDETGRFTLRGRGSRLIGGATQLTLQAEEAREQLLSGFFPLIKTLEEVSEEGPRSAILEGGLPYARDAAVTRHLARFVKRYCPDGVDAVLFHGGSVAPPLVRERILESLKCWFMREPVVLKNPDPRLGVSHGACLHALGRKGLVSLVEAGLSNHYFLGMETPKGHQWICIAEASQKEGQRQELNLDLVLKTRQRVRFELGSLPSSCKVHPGQSAPEEPGIQGLLRVRLEGTDPEIPVRLYSELLPTTELKLEFESRRNAEEVFELLFELSGSAKQSAMMELHGVDEILERAFGRPDDSLKPRELQGLMKALEQCLQKKRREWPAEVCRYIGTRLADLRRGSRRSALHEQVYESIFGFSMRPGFGLEGDREILRQAEIRAYCQHPSEPQNRISHWILLRRLCGGLPATLQADLWEAHGDLVLGRKARLKLPGGHPTENERLEMLRMYACFEGMSAPAREELLQFAMKAVRRGNLKSTDWWILARLASRRMSYGDPLNLVSAELAEKVAELLMLYLPTPEAVNALAHLAIPEPLSPEHALKPALRARILTEVKDAGRENLMKDAAMISGISLSAGEALPVGLRLRQSGEHVQEVSGS